MSTQSRVITYECLAPAHNRTLEMIMLKMYNDMANGPLHILRGENRSQIVPSSFSFESLKEFCM